MERNCQQGADQHFSLTIPIALMLIGQFMGKPSAMTRMYVWVRNTDLVQGQSTPEQTNHNPPPLVKITVTDLL